MDDSAHNGSKRSVKERIDIRVGVERRRRWGREDKLRIVRESLGPNVVVTEVARRHEISTGLHMAQASACRPHGRLRAGSHRGGC
jgi:transposase